MVGDQRVRINFENLSITRNADYIQIVCIKIVGVNFDKCTLNN